jgi:hypothetical protein
LKNLQSPLAAPHLSALYIELRKCVFFTNRHKYLGKFSQCYILI